MSIGLAFGEKYANATNLYAQLVNASGINFGYPYYDGFVHLGNGHYMFNGIIPYDFRGGIKFYIGSKLMSFLSINPETFEYKDVKVSSRCYLGSNHSFISNSDSSVIELRLSDDYLAAEGRSIDLTSNDWPNLIESINTFNVDGDTFFTKYLLIINQNTLRIELTKQELQIIGAGRWNYEIRSLLSNNHILTLTVGNLIIVPPFGD
jgi:hypothetical protein